MKKKKKIGLMLGSFNPPHIGHLHVAIQALKEMDEVWMVPAWQNPWKESYEATYEQRCEMLTAMVSEDLDSKYPIFVSCIEGGLKPKYTYELLEYLLNIYPTDAEFYIVGGTDNTQNIQKWKKGDWINDNFKFVTIDRSTINCSSSDIRKKIKNKEIIIPFVTKNVDEYIKDYNLYD